MARLYAATGDAIARLDGHEGIWETRISLTGSGAQCLALDPSDPDVVYAGLRDGGVRRTTDGGESWRDCGLPAPGVFSLAVSAADGAVYAGTEPSALYRSDDRGETWDELTSLLILPSRPTWSFPPRPWTSHVRWIAPSPHDAELSARRDRAWRAHALDRSRRDLARPPSGCAAGRPLARVASACHRTGIRGRRRRCGLEQGRRRLLARRRRRQGQELHLVGRGRSGRPGALVRLGEHGPVRGARRPRSAGADLRAT